MTPAALCLAIVALWGAEVPQHRACWAADAIVAHHGKWEPELLAAIGVNETRLQPWRVGSRGEVGAWQTKLYGPDRRARERQAGLSYEAGVIEAVRKLDEAEARCVRDRRRNVRRCTIAIYRGGPKAWAAVSGPAKIESMAEAIRKAAGHAPGRRVGS